MDAEGLGRKLLLTLQRPSRRFQTRCRHFSSTRSLRRVSPAFSDGDQKQHEYLRLFWVNPNEFAPKTAISEKHVPHCEPQETQTDSNP